MAEEEPQSDEQSDDEGNGKKKKKKILLILPVLLLLLGGGGWFAATTFGLIGGNSEEAASDEIAVTQEATPAFYHDLPEMVVNLSSKEKRAQFLKMKIALEVSDQEISEAITPHLPRVLDLFQVYLRELRKQDLEGSAGIYRLKEELLKRINLAVYPSRVNRILFKEIIVQ